MNKERESMNSGDVIRVDNIMIQQSITPFKLTKEEAELVERRAQEYDILGELNPLFREEAAKLRAIL